MKVLAAAILCVSYAFPAAALVSGNRALEICTSGEPSEFGFCQGLVLGAVGMAIEVDYMAQMREQPSGLANACVPEEASVAQLTDVFWPAP